MKVAVYVLEHKGAWILKLSLDLRIDLEWWEDIRQLYKSDDLSNGCKIVILSSSMPLGWASTLRERFAHRNEMNSWGTQAWNKYVMELLKDELKAEEEARRKKIGAPAKDGMNKRSRWVSNVEFFYSGMEMENSSSILSRSIEDFDWETETLTEMMSGRSLLEPELINMLSERCPELLKHWRSAAQIAYLKGWIQLEPAVTSQAMHAAVLKKKGPQHREAGGLLMSVRAVATSLRHGSRALRGVIRRRSLVRCQRCGSAALARTACAACGLTGCAYCEVCLALGRSRACALLLRSAALPAVLGTADLDPIAAVRRWGLSAAQAEAACAALAFLAKPRERFAKPSPERFLLWAVTGAGKTEMTFPLLHYVLDCGGKVLVASPRRDVVLELAPRITAAFPDVQATVLYGGSTHRWEKARLVLSTTHQLLRFYQAFDLVIIDELDAYPYHNNPMLTFAAESACRPDGRFIFLSATPPVSLQREINKGRLLHAKVPARYHGFPLPVPHRMEFRRVDEYLNRHVLPASFTHSLEVSIRRGAQIFMFVSRIRHIEPLAALLRMRFPELPIQGTSSQDKDRAEKVLAFRSGNIRLLVTTTILERGVTVPKSDVYILDADSSLFDGASLIQMAGRAGRSMEDPSGKVIFASSRRTISQRSAIREIEWMNKIAYREGFLHSQQGLQR